MSDLTPYEQLQVTEDASFEEIQAARDRLVATAAEDERTRELIEAAYDAVLMDRLRRRQEGKIKVPERIRYAERLAEEAPPKPSPTRLSQSPPWLQGLLDTPSPREVLIPAGVYITLGGLSFYSSTPAAHQAPAALSNTLALLLALGVGFSLYWLNRKQQRLGRAFLLSLIAVLVGAILATLGLQVAAPSLVGLNMPQDSLVTCLIFVVLWLVSSFLH